MHIQHWHARCKDRLQAHRTSSWPSGRFRVYSSSLNHSSSCGATLEGACSGAAASVTLAQASSSTMHAGSSFIADTFTSSSYKGNELHCDLEKAGVSAPLVPTPDTTMHEQHASHRATSQ